MDECILVVGAASGIGKETALELTKYGKKLILIDINKEGLDTLQQYIPGCLTIVSDLTLIKDIERVADKLEENKILISGIADTVGKSLTMPLKSIYPSMYIDLFSTNVIGIQLLIGELLRRNLFSPVGASVVIISSIVAEVGARGKAAYGASKGAINSMVKSMALELADELIRINAICPGTIQSEMMKRLEINIGSQNLDIIKDEYPLEFGTKKDVVSLILFLLSSESKWMTGATLNIDGGYSAH